MDDFSLDRYPTLLPESDSIKVGHCPICDKAVFADESIVLLEDGPHEIVVHENCAVFRESSLIDFLDILGIDYCKGEAKDLLSDEYDWI